MRSTRGQRLTGGVAGPPALVAQPVPNLCEDNLQDPVNEVADWMTAQRAGTCYYRCVVAAARYLLRLQGHSQAQVKDVTLAVRRQYMLRVARDLSREEVPVHESDRTLIKLGCKQTALAALKGRGDRRVSEPQLAQIRAQLQQVEQLLEYKVRALAHAQVVRHRTVAGRWTEMRFVVVAQVIVGTEDGYAGAEALTVAVAAGFRGLRRCEHRGRSGLGLVGLEGPDTPTPGVRRLNFLELLPVVESPAALATGLQQYLVRRPHGSDVRARRLTPPPRLRDRTS